MKRLIAVVLATAAAAAVAAAITLPAGANDSDSGPDPEATFVNCLRTNGVDIPADTRGFAIKQWLAAHESQPSVSDAIQKCQPDDKRGGGIKVDDLIACLKSHGLNPPTAPDQLKEWLGSQPAETVKACGVEIGKRDDDHGGADIADCLRKNGAAVPAGTEGIALKNWIRDHMSEPAVADALKKCEMDKPDCGGGEVKPAAPKPDATAAPDVTIEQ
jgi:hypothetical protein